MGNTSEFDISGVALKIGSSAVMNVENADVRIFNEGQLVVDGTVNIKEGGTVALFYKSIDISSGGTINIFEQGILNVEGSSILNNHGTINNYGTINDNAYFNSDGTFNNCGTFNVFNPFGLNVNPPPTCNSGGDTEPPQVTFKVGDKHGKVLSNGGTTPSKSIEIKFTVTDNVGVTSVECSLNGPGKAFDKPLSPCTSPIELSKLVKGKYTFTVIATDEAGNGGEDDPHIFTWTVK